eukprot:TRINITY_DN839_c1_g1_i2.p1 TRINITY_DN839_c1_g1~~TRINITY_DN839_c1_g1_i2.p1  ORF type:complete len:224 (-),score=62.09 TRINITY_DN839_c1_g1_i2:103-774(-)
MAATPVIKVYSYKPSPSVAKAEIAGKFGGVPVEYIEGFEMGKTNKTDDYLNLNPNGQVPTAITPDGPLFESTAIAYYVARIGTDKDGLLGVTPYQQGVVDEWVHFSRSRLEALYPLFAFSFGYGKYEQAKFEEALKKLTDAFTVLERHFNHVNTPFLTGSRITLADIAVVTPLVAPLRLSITEAVLAPYPKTRAFIEHFLANDHVKAVTGPTTIATTFTPPAQ